MLMMPWGLRPAVLLAPSRVSGASAVGVSATTATTVYTVYGVKRSWHAYPPIQELLL